MAFAAGTALLALMLTASAAGAAPTQKLKTFGTGDVTIVQPDAATIVNDAGEYGGVYINSKSQSGKLLKNTVFQFTSRGDVGGGAPRFSIPVDDPATAAKLDGYAFIDAAGCGAEVGTNDLSVATLVSTQNPACHVNFASLDYANWDTFAATNPTLKIASGYIPFIIADVAGTYEVTDIVLR